MPQTLCMDRHKDGGVCVLNKGHDGIHSRAFAQTYTWSEHQAVVTERDDALAEVERLRGLFRRARSLGARSGTNINWANDLFDLIDEALPRISSGTSRS